jgi:S-DNA-T family DNA segregation ATPase FtsK/SpoIIIE
VKNRLLVAGLVAVFGVAVTVVLLVLAPVVWQWVALSCVVAVLGAAGTPVDKPVVDSPAVSTFRAPRLTAENILAALGALQVTLINQAVGKGWGREAFPDPIMRDGPGWRAHVDLPLGVTATDIMERRDKLASGLRRPVGCVWPEPDNAQHPGRLVLWVGDQDMSKARQPEWPLLKSGTVDLFRPQPFGTDQRGRWVPLTLMFTSVVIGAIPRMGKTFALRELLLIAGLDPRAELHAYDLKGTGDLSPLETVAHRYRAGDEEDDIAYAIADMRALQEELRRRAKVIRELPRDVCPENKVTPELAGKRKLGLHPIVMGVDECQVLFEHPEHGKEFEAICTDLVKRGPALGIMLILATQRPDAKSLPTGISANAGTRYCLKVMGHTENDMVLGTSAHRNGIKATMFTWADKGIGYLVGSGEDARITRSVYIDAPTAEKIALRARAARITAGLLTGHAAGQDIDPADAGPSHNLLEDLAAVWPGEQDKAWSEVLVSRLAELRPEVYAGWTPKTLAPALEPFGIGTVQVWGTAEDGRGVNRKGIRRDHLTAALDTQGNRNRVVG